MISLDSSPTQRLLGAARDKLGPRATFVPKSGARTLNVFSDRWETVEHLVKWLGEVVVDTFDGMALRDRYRGMSGIRVYFRV